MNSTARFSADPWLNALLDVSYILHRLTADSPDLLAIIRQEGNV